MLTLRKILGRNVDVRMLLKGLGRGRQVLRRDLLLLKRLLLRFRWERETSLSKILVKMLIGVGTTRLGGSEICLRRGREMSQKEFQNLGFEHLGKIPGR